MCGLKSYKNLILKNLILGSLIILFSIPTRNLHADDASKEIQGPGNPGGNTVLILPQAGTIAIEEEVELAVAAANLTNQDLEIRTRRGNVYIFDHIVTNSSGAEQNIGSNSGAPPPQPEDDEDISSAYMQMSKADRKRFQENRMFFLTRAATLLDRGDLAVGFGSIVKHKLRTVCGKLWAKINLVEELAKDSLPDDEETPQTVKERGQEIIEGILHSFDRQLWVSAPVVAYQNEFAVTVGISGMIEGGAGQKGHGGSMGLGLNMGFNRDSKSFVFEIVSSIDTFKRAFTPFFMMGLTPSLGFGLRVNQQGQEMEKRNGTTLYPPAAPGFFSRSANMLSLGLSSALFSFPPLIGDAFWYVNNTSRKPLFRIEISAVTNRFIRVFTPERSSQASNNLEIPSDELALKRTKTIVDMINIVNGWFQTSYKTCRGFFIKKA
jgi:hypothetical protein